MVVLFDVLWGSEPATVEQLRRLFLQQLAIFTSCNIVMSTVSLATAENPATRNLEACSLSALLSTLPYGIYGAVYLKGGALSFFVSFGLLCAAARTALYIASALLVGISCQIEQSSFKYCSTAGLPCLANSTCSAREINDYNQNLPSGAERCTAWSTDECKGHVLTQISMGVGAVKTTMFFLRFATALVPVYAAYLLHHRLENELSKGAYHSVQLEDAHSEGSK
eukprot:Sspe_Gene.88423::Locus_60459_Transcript_2_3_Confidence_0.333_Length_892::g.88423::m.88423